jgi:tetratricopeptide (TPR) repeat protein
LLLWAAAGLVAIVFLLRLVLGPAERSRSPGIVVHVPEAASEVVAADPFAEELSERSLIGGDIAPVKRAPLAAADQAQRPEREPPPAAAGAPAPEPESDDQAPASEKRVPTVSAVSVRGGLARAASSRPATVSSKPAPPEYKTQARALYREGKYREAAEAYELATKRNATDAAAFAGLGASLLATGDLRKAIAAYQQAVRLEPGVSGFQAALGRAYLKNGDRSRARAAYSKALELDPNNQAARTGMASAKAR